MNQKKINEDILRRIKDEKLKSTNESAGVKRNEGYAQDSKSLGIKLAQPIRKVNPVVDPKKG